MMRGAISLAALEIIRSWYTHDFKHGLPEVTQVFIFFDNMTTMLDA